MVKGETDQRLDIATVQPERRVEQVTSRAVAAHGQGLVEDCPAAHGQVYGIHVVRPLALRSAAVCGHEFDAHGPGEPRGDLVLHLEDVAARLVKTLGPEVRAGFCVDELRVDADAVAAAAGLHAAFHRVTHAKFAADHARVHWPVLEGEGSIASYDEGARNA